MFKKIVIYLREMLIWNNDFKIELCEHTYIPSHANCSKCIAMETCIKHSDWSSSGGSTNFMVFHSLLLWGILLLCLLVFIDKALFHHPSVLWHGLLIYAYICIYIMHIGDLMQISFH